CACAPLEITASAANVPIAIRFFISVRLPSSADCRTRAGGDQRTSLRGFARAGPVAARDEEERAFQATRLEDSLDLLAQRAAYVLDAAAVERAHDGRRRQLEARTVVGLDGLAQPGVCQIHVRVQIVFARGVREIENTEDKSRHGSSAPILEAYS